MFLKSNYKSTFGVSSKKNILKYVIFFKKIDLKIKIMITVAILFIAFGVLIKYGKCII